MRVPSIIDMQRLVSLNKKCGKKTCVFCELAKCVRTPFTSRDKYRKAQQYASAL